MPGRRLAGSRWESRYGKSPYMAARDRRPAGRGGCDAGHARGPGTGCAVQGRSALAISTPAPWPPKVLCDVGAPRNRWRCSGS